MKKNLTILLIIFMYSYTTIFAECLQNSGPTQSCEPCKEYPYKICVDGRLQTICTSSPNSYNDIYKIHNMPIRVKIENNPTVGVGSITWEEKPGGYLLSDPYNQNDMDLAANKWNCICGFDIEGSGGTTVPALFSDDSKNFKDPYKDPSCYNTKDICGPSDKTIYFNTTKEFLYGTPLTDINTPITRLLMNDHWIMAPIYEETATHENYKGVISYLESRGSAFNSDYEIYNLVDVAMKQIGEVLGMGYSENCGCSDSHNRYNIMAPQIAQVNGSKTIPHYYGLGGAENASYGDCDKCMFQKLYCESEPCPEGIYEYQQYEHKLYPNPADNTVNIDFKLEKNTEVTIKITDEMGNVLFTPIENILYDAGSHTEYINIKSLPAGAYFMLVDTPYSRNVKSFVVK